MAKETLQEKDRLKSIIVHSTAEAKHVALAVAAEAAEAANEPGAAAAAAVKEDASSAADTFGLHLDVQEDEDVPSFSSFGHAGQAGKAGKARSKRPRQLGAQESTAEDGANDGKRPKSDAESATSKVKKGYTKEEAANFSELICVVGKDQDSHRMKCAADDAIACINWVINMEFSEAEKKSSEEGILKAKGLALSLFCEFLLAGEVVVGGKTIKIWSALRPELQNLVRMAKAKLAVQGSERTQQHWPERSRRN